MKSKIKLAEPESFYYNPSINHQSYFFDDIAQ